MVHQAAQYSDAYLAWEQWSLTEFEFRSKCLLTVNRQLLKDNIAISSIVAYHLAAAKQVIGQTDWLEGPTGETNELYTAGRGVTLLIQEKEGDKARAAIIAQLTAAAVSGNSVIICSDDVELTSLVKRYFNDESLPLGLIQFASRDSYHSFLMNDVRTVGYIGSPEKLITLNRELAKREGVIVSLISETDFDRLPASHDPRLSYRFVSERTRTINITAIGGNASLLELGSSDH